MLYKLLLNKLNTCSEIMIDYSKIEVCLDNGHGINTPGKRSCDGKLLEYKWCREIVQMIAERLHKLGIKYYIVTPELNDVGLTVRANRVNARVTANKAKGISTILFSVHVNAAGNGSQWTKATGWECWTTKGKTKSDDLAECLYDAAEEYLKIFDIKMRTDKSDGDRDKENNWTILYKSNCPCVLTENLFMDNKDECEFLLSDYGKSAIANLHTKAVILWCQKN